MHKKHEPRLPYLDPYLDAEALEQFLQNICHTRALREQDLRPIRRESQHYFVSSADNASGIALLRYALGYSLDSVRDELADSARAWLRVFELYGTASAVSRLQLREDPTNPQKVLMTELTPPGAKDYSYTNPESAIDAVCLALATQQDEVAQRIAVLFRDPPSPKVSGAAYYTGNEWHLAHAVRGLFLGDSALVSARLNQFRRTEEPIWCQKEMLRALLETDTGGFKQRLDELLVWHEKRAHRKENRLKYEYYLCLRAIGFTALAVRRGLLKVDDLPHGNVFLPIDLIVPTSSHTPQTLDRCADATAGSSTGGEAPA